jgi:eukaryotic-like serine/threonine-protein kinase
VTDLRPCETALSFDRYRVLGELGRGGYGAVYLAADDDADRLVALKVPTGVRDAELLVRFLREAYSLALVKSEHVPTVWEVGSSRRRPFYAMEFVAGGSLHRRIVHHGPLGQAETAALLYGLLEALTAIHAQRLLHRDIKPTNIILRFGAAEAPVIVDFGLARLDFDLGLTEPELFLGTPEYTPPETLEGRPPDARGDLYAVGMTVRYALQGWCPFTALSGRALYDAVAAGAGPPPRDLVEPELGQLIGALCEPDPDDRPVSAEEALGWLRSLPDPQLAPTRRVVR